MGENEAPDIGLLHSVWDHSKKFSSQKNVDVQPQLFDHFIASVFSTGPYYFFILDIIESQILYMDPLIQTIHGVDPNMTTYQDMISLIHPEDITLHSKAETLKWNLLNPKTGTHPSKNHKISYSIRLRVSDGSYQLFNQQSMILSTTADGGIEKMLIIYTNISHLSPLNTGKLSAFGLGDETSFLIIDIDHKVDVNVLKSQFTKRELEIIRLLSRGHNSLEIAEKLFISYDTVKTHRKNILHKAECKNVTQLITKCITERLI